MSWDKHHDYRMRDLEVIGPMVADIFAKDAKTLDKLRQENQTLREENELLRSQVVPSRVRSFACGVAVCLLITMLAYTLLVFCFSVASS